MTKWSPSNTAPPGEKTHPELGNKRRTCGEEVGFHLRPCFHFELFRNLQISLSKSILQKLQAHQGPSFSETDVLRSALRTEVPSKKAVLVF